MYFSNNPHGQAEGVWKADKGDVEQAPNSSAAKGGSTGRRSDQGLHQQSSPSVQKARIKELSKHLSAELDFAFI